MSSALVPFCHDRERARSGGRGRALPGACGGSGTRSLWADELVDRPVAARLLDEPLVLVRLDGEVRAFKDLCVHRGTALSLGWVEDGCLVCPYHGWTYDPDGVCTRIPVEPRDEHPAQGADHAVRRRRARRPHLGLPAATDGQREPAMPLPDVPRVGRRHLPQDQDPAVRLALQRRAAGRELRRLQPFRVGPRGHPRRPLEAGDPRSRRLPDADRRSGSGSASRSRQTSSRATTRRGGPHPARPHPLHDLDAVHRAARPAAARTTATSCCSSRRARCPPRRRATSPGTRATTTSIRRATRASWTSSS